MAGVASVPGLLPGLTTLAGAFGGFIFGRLAEVASERRSGYAAASARLVELWRGCGPTRVEDLRGELVRLVIGNNPDLFGAIEDFLDALIARTGEAADRLVDLVEEMRRTSVLGNVRYRYLGGGPSQRALLHKLITSELS